MKMNFLTKMYFYYCVVFMKDKSDIIVIIRLLLYTKGNILNSF